MRIPRITDAHVHLRQGELCEQVKRYTGEVCAHAIAMPNTIPPITTDNVQRMHKEYWMQDCDVWMTCKLMESTTTRQIEQAKKIGVIGYKLYPVGTTTNSEDGIPERWLRNLPATFRKQLDALAANKLILMHHGEMPSEFIMDREAGYCWVFKEIVRRTPDLKNVFEHVSTAIGVRVIDMLREEGFEVFGTITLHHLMLTLNDVVGHVHNHCKPIAKRDADRQCLLRAARSRKWYGLGSDSAPHWEHAKHCGAAGIFSAPVLLPGLAELFEEQVLVRFASTNANEFYGFGVREGRKIELTLEKWNVPDKVGALVPFLAGREMKWKVKHEIRDEVCNRG